MPAQTAPAQADTGRREAMPVASLGSFVLLTLRVALAGVFCLAATIKLMYPQSFWEAIHAFKAVDSKELGLMATHTLPWVELIAGVALMVGLWTREAALVIGLLLVVFIAAIIGAIDRGLAGVPCSCFGNYHLFCKNGVGWCKVFENIGLIAIAATLVCTGGGKLALDSACCCCKPARPGA